MNINKFIIKDINLFLNCEEFTKNFTKMTISLLLDFYIEYNQIKLYLKCRDMTTFQILLKLLRITILPIRVINLVRQFVRATYLIFTRHVFHEAVIYLNNVEIKKLKKKYNEKEVKLNIRKYILKYL